MPVSRFSTPYNYARCIRVNSRAQQDHASFRARTLPTFHQYASTVAQSKKEEDGGQAQDGYAKEKDSKQPCKEQDEGAMTRRLRNMSEAALESGGRSSQKTVSEAGFSEDLKRQLEERIASANFKAEHRSAFAEAELPSTASRHTRDIATADPWTGTESIHDASLRMLNDARKPLKLGRGARIPGPSAQLPRSVDTGKGPTRAATGTRLANARDRSGLYSSLKDSEVDEAERQKRFQELKDRFSPNARAVLPGTIQGLASLANERIENAITRGQFKNLPNRGQKVERDYNASNPFLDTTEYFMNKIIQKQEIVPPWIEKQQELVATANKFRSRLRNDWKRHAARMIASKGGTLQDQIRRAEAYAKAELVVNPQKKKEEILSTVHNDGHISQISLSGELKAAPPSKSSNARPILEEVVAETITVESSSDAESAAAYANTEKVSSQTISVNLHSHPSTVPRAPYPFRDPAWESTESAYHTVAINDLNSKTRSYNLQAPDLAKKPYFSLKRELEACFADVAPQLAEAIRQRAWKPSRQTEGFGQALSGDKGVLDRFVGEKVQVRDERVGKQYGFRQFWKDLWEKGEKT